MENSLFMVIMFPDNRAETVRKMQAIMQFIDELNSLTRDPDASAGVKFLDDDDLPF